MSLYTNSGGENAKNNKDKDDEGLFIYIFFNNITLYNMLIMLLEMDK